MKDDKDCILTKLAETESELDSLHAKRHSSYTRDRQGIDEEMRELRFKQLKLREQLEELQQKGA